MPADAAGDVTVCIPTFDDDPDVLAACLDAAAAQPLAHRIVIVDMSRGTAIRDVASAREATVDYHHFPQSQGTSDSRNQLVELCPTRYLLFVDADAVPEPGWAAAMRRGFDDDPNAAIVGARAVPVWPKRPPRLFTTQPALVLLGMFDLGDEPKTVPYVMGTSYALDTTRIPDPAFAVHLGRGPGRGPLAHEEVRLADQVRAAGWTLRYQPRAVVRHHVREQRLTWEWMRARIHAAGRETHLAHDDERLELELGPRDRMFQAAIAPWFFAGKLQGLPPDVAEGERRCASA